MIMNDRRRTYSGQNLKEFIITGSSYMPNKEGNQWKSVVVKTNNGSRLSPAYSLHSLKGYLLCNGKYLTHYSNFKTAYDTDSEVIVNPTELTLDKNHSENFATHNLHNINYDITTYYDRSSDTYYIRKIKINLDGSYEILSEHPLSIQNDVAYLPNTYGPTYNNWLYKDNKNLYIVMPSWVNTNYSDAYIIKSTTGDLDGFNNVIAYRIPTTSYSKAYRIVIKDDILYVNGIACSLDLNTAVDYSLSIINNASTGVVFACCDQKLVNNKYLYVTYNSILNSNGTFTQYSDGSTGDADIGGNTGCIVGNYLYSGLYVSPYLGITAINLNTNTKVDINDLTYSYNDLVIYKFYI